MVSIEVQKVIDLSDTLNDTSPSKLILLVNNTDQFYTFYPMISSSSCQPIMYSIENFTDEINPTFVELNGTYKLYLRDLAKPAMHTFRIKSYFEGGSIGYS